MQVQREHARVPVVSVRFTGGEEVTMGNVTTDLRDRLKHYRLSWLKTIDLFGPSAVEVFGPTLTRAA
jgi:hypothetical protein